MKNLIALPVFAAFAGGASAVVMPLEWNTTYRTDVPYEVEISPAKLEKLAGADAKAGYAVKADGKQLDVQTFKGKAPGTIDLRFSVPAGTKKLTCETDAGALQLTDSSKIDNLFAGALDAANLGRWQLDKGLKASAAEGGVLFKSSCLGDTLHATYTVDVPAALQGKLCKVEFDVMSRTKMVWANTLRVEQLDAAGKVLPDSVSDPRWTSQMRPANKFTGYREDGIIHPRATKLRLSLGFRGDELKVDNYGMPLNDRSWLLPELLVTRVAVRPAAQLPFPKYDDCHFVPGVSGRPDDTALVLGGPNSGGFWYQTHSQGCWAESKQLRDERDCYFPNQAGTVEAWFKADWAKAKGNELTIFQGHQGYVACERHEGQKTIVGVTWNRSSKRLMMELKDRNYRVFKFKSDKIDLPANAWFHFAAVWQPGGTAKVFIDGKKALEGSLKEFVPIDITDKKVKHPNEQGAHELYIGCNWPGSRGASSMGTATGSPLVEGAVDQLRVSTGCRYMEDFTPSKELTMDDDVRAKFDFDRSFDGRASGGQGYILGSYRSMTDRVDHLLKVKGEGVKSVQYYPKKNLPENDPFKVLDIFNYKQLPKASEYTQARREVQKSFTLKTGESVRYEVPAGTYPDFVEVANVGKETLQFPLAINRGELDVRSFGDCADGLNLGDASDRDRVNRLFQMVISASDYFMNHNATFPYGSDKPKMVCYDAMVVLNSYCGFECGPLNNMTANMLATVAGCPAVQTGGFGHSFEEVFYDGKNHIYDLSAQKFFPAMDNESAAYLREVGDQPAIHNRVRQSPDHFMRKSTRGHSVQTPDYREKVGVSLRPGEAFRVWRGNNGEQNNLQCKNLYGKPARWDAPGYDKAFAPRYEKETGAEAVKNPIRRIDRFFPDESNGFITFSGKPAGNPAFINAEGSSFCYDVKTGYPITWASYAAFRKDGSPAPLEISTNFKDFRPLPKPSADGITRLDYLVRARHGYWIRVKAPIADIARFEAVTEVLVNRRTFPGHAVPGKHELMLKAANAGTAKVTVQWRENVKEIKIAGGAFSGTIPGFERQTVLLEPSKGLALEVTGASGKAKAVATDGLQATLAGGKLTLSSKATKPFVGAVTIVDGDAKRELTVIVCEGARMALAVDGELKGGATKVAADADRVQPAVMLKNSGEDGVVFKFDRVPAGKYLIFNLSRFEGGLLKGESGGKYYKIALPGGGKKDFVKTGSAANGNCDFLKAPYGVRGGRGNWKWDYPYVLETRGSSWSGWEVEPEPFAATDTLEYMMSSTKEEGLELAACCIFPDSVDQDFRGMLKKIFCGLNCQPFRIH